ncbi:MAG: four helix bundle protein [Bacteroidales bacterium]|nr:four helix bundle protein [Bacteroidales bacterium]
MDEFYSLEKLEIYQIANKIGDDVWKIVSDWNYFEKDTIGKQFTRSTDSISANIAEGYGRYSFKENIQFCYYSRGSLLESKNWLIKANERDLVNKEKGDQLNEDLKNLLKRLNGYISYLKKQIVKK